MFEPLEVLTRIRHPVGHRVTPEKFVRPEMKMLFETHFFGQFGNRVESIYRIPLPAFSRRKDFGA